MSRSNSDWTSVPIKYDLCQEQRNEIRDVPRNCFHGAQLR